CNGFSVFYINLSVPAKTSPEPANLLPEILPGDKPTGNINPGEVSLGQNLSNLLRLVLLYKYGGVYIDTDVIVLKSFNNLSNVIGAQSMNIETKTWSRLNNAVLVFDKHHPLLYKFIQEFALTFDGNKWGHNGPYLVSRVVGRVTNRPGFNFTVLPPPAFYPQIRRQSYAVHLWNRQSKDVRAEE
ncbi:hypothetical protein Gotri_025407, partial [Gossypium trilobum]|nr:hypothetical protein [Gossypium trilobum]